MTQKQVLIVWGGWEGHDPQEAAEIFAKELSDTGLNVSMENSLEPLAEPTLLEYDLIVPCWTMGELSKEQNDGLLAAVQGGVGLGGFHGGMGDAFRGNLSYEWVTGGHFVGHPHVGPYRVRLTDQSSPITDGMPTEWDYDSEQYYMMVDPVIRVLADTIYEYEGRRITMPVVWTKFADQGRVFYSALGHKAEEFRKYPEVRQMTTRGLLWAAGVL